MRAHTLTITDPLVIGPAQLHATNVPEADYPVWSAATTYTLANRVIFGGSIWEALMTSDTTGATNIGRQPDLTRDIWWQRVRPTNRWGAFDTRHSTDTAQAGGFWYEIDAGYSVGAVHILGMTDCTSVRLRLTDPVDGLVYDSGELAVGFQPDGGDWWSWLFGQLIEIDEQHWTDLPNYPGARLRIDVEGGPACAVDTIMIGQIVTWGRGVERGLRLPRDSFSRMEEDLWGEVVLERRAFIRGMNFNLLLPNSQLDAFNRFIDERDTVVMFWVATDRFTSTQIMGYYTRVDASMDYPEDTPVAIDVRGMKRN